MSEKLGLVGQTSPKSTKYSGNRGSGITPNDIDPSKEVLDPPGGGQASGSGGPQCEDGTVSERTDKPCS